MSDDHDFEPAHGLPELLPPNERLLWQGSPDWKRMACDAMHIRGLAIYFAVLLAWRGANSLSNGHGVPQALVAVLWLLPIALLALSTIALLAWLTARTAVYTVTNRRVVMRVGIVLTITFNLPFKAIESASLHARTDGSGDIALALSGSDRIAYVNLWPHARPWKIKKTQPMLRALPDARPVAALLAGALAESAGMPRPALSLVPGTGGARGERGAQPDAMVA
ncbi:photosynthetic complex putative assembly protein PuhB [Variovorax sp. J22R133]|uniref:photosynthetic complex putative assembly protein PuhB n=1 Tax=Variovorax brevis TaxID=3053503 RepID=UPI00257644D7|nr:photosynthetic complex putative assembly protein PuhB [Variovorax sp. J22R133]MDM0113807.1 photosynthetic complex putative assembly protein PuhB [Variovorax sp. J22R133]